MGYLSHQILSALLAVACFPLISILPGRLILRIFPSARRLFPSPLGAELLLSTSLMPVVFYLAAKAVPAPLLLLALLPAIVLYLLEWYPSKENRPSGLVLPWNWRSLGWPLLWLAVLLAITVDVPVGDRLYAPSVAFDWSKHVMVTDAIVRTGLPPENPAYFPGHPVALCYYYLWHLLNAVFVWGEIIPPRAAVTAGAFWSGLALFAVLYQWLALSYPAEEKNRRRLLLLALAVGSFALVLLAMRVGLYLGSSTPLEMDFLYYLQTGSEPVFGWLNTLVTAPHHAAALVCVLTGFLVLRRADEKTFTLAAILGGLSFASAAGMSIWIGLTAAVIGLTWLAMQLLRRDKHDVTLWIAAGMVAAVAILPLVLELHRASELTGSPIGFQVRSFTLTNLIPDPWKAWANLLCLPLNYLIEIGFPLLASFLVWKSGDRLQPTTHRLFLRVVFWTSLAFLSVTASVVRHNDLAWRGALFIQMVCLIWSWPFFVALMPRLSESFPERSAVIASRWPRLWTLAVFGLWIGWMSTVTDAIMIRFANFWIDLPQVTSKFDHYSSLALPNDKKTAERLARYVEGCDWLRHHTPPTAHMVLNPARESETVFFLYANRPVVLADLYNSTLFGIRRSGYRTLNQSLAPLFQLPVKPWDETRLTLAGLGANYFIVRSDDPVWNQPSDWPSPVYQNAKMAIFAVQPTDARPSSLQR